MNSLQNSGLRILREYITNDTQITKLLTKFGSWDPQSLEVADSRILEVADPPSLEVVLCETDLELE